MQLKITKKRKTNDSEEVLFRLKEFRVPEFFQNLNNKGHSFKQLSDKGFMYLLLRFNGSTVKRLSCFRLVERG